MQKQMSIARFQPAVGTAATLLLAFTVLRLASAIEPTRWPDEPEHLILAGAWWTAILFALWSAASAGAWTISLHQGRTPSRRLRRLTAPGARRLAESLLALHLLALPACAPSPSAAPTMSLVDGSIPQASTTDQPTTDPPTTAPPTTAPTTTARPTTAPPTTAPTTTARPTTVRPTTVPPTTVPPTTDPPTTAPAPLDDPGPVDQPEIPVATTVTVRSGDNLWSIAAEAVRRRVGREPSCAEVARYWRSVLAVNDVASGNLDLIMPGELITLPPFP